MTDSVIGARGKTMASRKALVEAWQQVEQVCCSLEDRGPEMTDKSVIIALAKALWLVLDYIVRGIDYDERIQDIRASVSHEDN